MQNPQAPMKAVRENPREYEMGNLAMSLAEVFAQVSIIPLHRQQEFIGDESGV